MEYIKETQDEDGRVTRLLSSSLTPSFNETSPGMLPFTSFTANGAAVPPPPKFHVEM
jgi:hypothetical protein